MSAEFPNSIPSTPKQKEHPFAQEVVAIASELHDEWRLDRKKEDGTYESRIKDDGYGGQVDIANTEYRDLPEKWQRENYLAAKAVVDFVLDIKGLEDINSPHFLETAASFVHDRWMHRNPKEAWNAAQHVPYAELPESEKQKDRNQVLRAIKKLDGMYKVNEKLFERSH